MLNIGFLNELLNSIAHQGRSLVDRARGLAGDSGRIDAMPLADLAALLLSARGEASGVVIAREIVSRYPRLEPTERRAFLLALNNFFAASPEQIRAAFSAYDSEPSARNHARLLAAVEPPRQEVIRRLNLAPGNTGGLVRMREDLLDALPDHPELAALDNDFRHLFSSWFNRGFLVLRRIDWSSPAQILEKIIRYEAVHAIESWDDLRRRIEPADRRCYAFFHPALIDEPLIFVEVALMTERPAAIEPILAEKRDILVGAQATTAVFYSISNCQKGLAGISFGNFLIKQVVEDLRRDIPSLDTFVTLSPVPGFRQWVEAECANKASSFVSDTDRTVLASLDGEESDPEDMDGASRVLSPLLARYFLEARTPSGRVIDPVARFHLGNGARLERLNLFADFSAKGWRDSYAAMVNYLYDLKSIEENHERFATHGEVVASAAVSRALGTRRLHKSEATP
ncbi:MAG TPA: malonyl-CoA decarboxylase [Rhabdaerophilum sp.]|nr:malonyl-CoA decarboxylase [Rhabdaerophilum sp.]